MSDYNTYNPPSLSKTRPTYLRTCPGSGTLSSRHWADVGIAVPYDATGEVRVTCPRCSASRRKSRDRCLAVNTAQGTWFCHHCKWKGGLHGPLQDSALPPLPPPAARPDARKRAALRRTWGEAHLLTEGDPVWTYLHQRGLPLPRAELPAVLRYHPHLLYCHEDGQ